MIQLQSTYTVKLIDMFSNLENRLLFLVMEYFPNGNLDTFISTNPNLSSKQIAKIFIQILRGLIYLKENNIIHGDLKLQNILLSADDSPKLADFGLSAMLRAT